MPWRIISTTDCKLTPVELATLANIQGAVTGLQTRLNDVVGEFIGAMNAVEYPVASPDNNGNQPVPDQLRGQSHPGHLAFPTRFPDAQKHGHPAAQGAGG